MPTIEERVRKIEERNKSVELDKAWEMSVTRRVIIVAFTYVSISVLLQILHIEKPWATAVVPALAFLLSTFTMPLFKRVWVKWRTK